MKTELELPAFAMAETADGWTKLSPAGRGRWQGDGIEVEIASRDKQLEICIQPTVKPFLTLKLFWNWDYEYSDRWVLLGDQWERGFGDLEWRGIAPERTMPWYFLAHNGKTTLGYGVKTGANALCYWQANQEQIVLTADLRCGSEGVVLGQRQLHAATIVHFAESLDRTAFSCAQDFCATMCERPLMPPYPVYGGNNWYYAYGKSSHEAILNDSRFIASLVPEEETNRPFMVIDDGWQLTSGDGQAWGGPWVGNSRFPDMRRLAEEMKGIGVRPGIWFRPLVTAEYVPESWRRYRGPEGHVLDPSVPEVLSFIGDNVRKMTDWGYELLKHDYSTFDLTGKWGFQMKSQPNALPYSFQDRSRTTAEIVTSLYRTIADASGESLVIGCNTIGHLAAGLFEIQRTGDDTSGKSWERTRFMGVNTLAFRMPQHGTFFSHDADCVGITPQVPWELNGQWLKLLAASGTPLFVSVDPAIVNEEQKQELRRAFAVAAKPMPSAEPLDWLATTSPNRWVLNGKEERFSWHNDSLDVHRYRDAEWWK